MKLGFGLYRHMLNKEHYAFAKQCGASHVIIHLVDYFGHNNIKSDEEENQPIGLTEDGWGLSTNSEPWTVEFLKGVKQEIEENGLEVAGIENFEPALWHDILLDGPKKHEQIEKVKQTIRNVGAAGIGMIGYNFSLAGVAGRAEMFTRGGAKTVGLDGPNSLLYTPIKKGMIWNMRYEAELSDEVLPTISHEVLWERISYFLNEVVPVAEESGVILAAHPDDPPVPFVRNQPRLVYQRHMYQKLLDIKQSSSNQLEFCVGTLAEMTDGDLYEFIQKYVIQGKIAYVHLRNVKGQVPYYTETFIDEGDIDIKRVLEVLHRANFDGVVIPDHTPSMSCGSPWHAGMAFAMGYIKSCMQDVIKGSK